MRVGSPSSARLWRLKGALLASPILQPCSITLKKCSHAVYFTLSGANSEIGLFIVQVEFLISHKFPANCCSTLVFIESVRVVYGAEARLPCLCAVATAMQGSEALEERPFSEVPWKVLEQAGGVKWSGGCCAKVWPWRAVED